MNIYSKEARILRYRNELERARAEIAMLKTRIRELENRLLSPTPASTNAVPNPGGTD